MTTASGTGDEPKPGNVRMSVSLVFGKPDGDAPRPPVPAAAKLAAAVKRAVRNAKGGNRGQ